MSKKKPTVTFFTTNLEYMASTHAYKEVIWLRILASGIGFDCKTMRIECDSQSAICLAKNNMYHAHNKNVDDQYRFVREMVENEKVLI